MPSRDKGKTALQGSNTIFLGVPMKPETRLAGSRVLRHHHVYLQCWAKPSHHSWEDGNSFIVSPTSRSPPHCILVFSKGTDSVHRGTRRTTSNPRNRIDFNERQVSHSDSRVAWPVDAIRLYTRNFSRNRIRISPDTKIHLCMK